MFGLLVKVFGVSALVSIAIKYGAPTLAIAPTISNVLLAVWLPSTIAAIMLGWRWQKAR